MKNPYKYKFIIFDLDGTLYSQKQLRMRMLREILFYFTLRPWRYKEFHVVKKFRELRETYIGRQEADLDRLQFEWASEKLNIPSEKIRKIIEKWIYKRPLKHLMSCRYQYVETFFGKLKENSIKIAIYSDYPVYDKMKAMNLSADYMLCSTDAEVNAFKPQAVGIERLLKESGFKRDETLFIGDRLELDGACALNAGVDFELVDKNGDFYLKNVAI